jgi:hypothetical protein
VEVEMNSLKAGVEVKALNFFRPEVQSFFPQLYLKLNQ